MRALLIGLALVLRAPVAHAALFTGLGTLPGDSHSSASGISADGSVVVGTSAYFSFGRAVRWTAAGGMTELPGLSANVEGFAFATSADGSFTVGGSHAAPDYFLQAVRWGPGGDPMGLGFLPTDPDPFYCCQSRALAASGDGSVVVGSSSSGTTEEAFRWTPGDGIVGLGTLLGDIASIATGVSADGSVVVGTSSFQDANVPGSARSQPFRWTATTGMVAIGQLPGANWSNVWGISPDGSVIVGQGGAEAFRWTSAGGMMGLGFLPGGPSTAFATSADGSIVVGRAGADVAMIWDPVHGMRSLQDVLVNDYGLDLTGWTLLNASGISADGRTIVGNGFNPSGQPEAWLAILSDLSTTTTTTTTSTAPTTSTSTTSTTLPSGELVTICHKRNTIAVAGRAVPAHLAHGDSEGACPGP